MIKLIKYELLGKYKFFGILIIMTLLLNIFLLINPFSWMDGLVLALSFLIAGAVAVVMLVFFVGMFSQDIYEEKGYLTYTLPQKGYSIVASKIIASIVFYIIAMAIAGLFIMLFFNNVKEIKTGLDTIGVKINEWKIFFETIAMNLLNLIELLLMIYFSIAITKLAVAKKRTGKFAAFIVFVIICIALSYGSYFIVKIFPQNFHWQVFSGVSGAISSSSSSNEILTQGVPINIASEVFSIIIAILFFIGTSYIVEKKIDL